MTKATKLTPDELMRLLESPNGLDTLMGMVTAQPVTVLDARSEEERKALIRSRRLEALAKAREAARDKLRKKYGGVIPSKEERAKIYAEANRSATMWTHTADRFDFLASLLKIQKKDLFQLALETLEADPRIKAVIELFEARKALGS